MTRLFRIFAPVRLRSRLRLRSAFALPLFALRRPAHPFLALTSCFAVSVCAAGCGPSVNGGAGTSEEVAALLADVRVVPERVTVLGYDRSKFGGWAPAAGNSSTWSAPAKSGADTRDVVLEEWFGTEDGSAIPDPYTGDDLTAEGADIDHVYPLAAAWDFGAHAWDARTRRAFANDAERNLVPVASAVNREKSDLTPAEWLPPDRDLRCDYSARYLRVAVAWRLAVSVADWEAMADACDIRAG